MSATMLVGSADGAGLNEPDSNDRAMTPTAKATADPAKARAMAMAANSPPSGGPTNWLAVSSAAYSRPLARLSWSLSTTEGMTDWAAVSNRVSPTPSAKAVMYSIGRFTTSSTMPMARPPATSVRKAATLTIVRRRSRRSASAPAMSTKVSHGRRPTMATPAMSSGESVSWTASSGKAIQNTPSARLDAADEIHSFQ